MSGSTCATPGGVIATVANTTHYTVNGNGGDDQILLDGNSHVGAAVGAPGDDIVGGGSGSDQLFGGEGNERVIGDGDAGTDRPAGRRQRDRQLHHRPR